MTTIRTTSPAKAPPTMAINSSRFTISVDKKTSELIFILQSHGAWHSIKREDTKLG